MTDIEPETDTDWYGEALDLYVEANKAVVGMRRRGKVISLGINNEVVTLTPEQAREIAKSLASAAAIADTENAEP